MSTALPPIDHPARDIGGEPHRAAGAGTDRPRIAVVGGGQLARMLHVAAIPLDVELRFLVQRADDPVTAVAPRWRLGDPSDRGELATVARGCTAITVEHELVDPDALAWLGGRGIAVHPSPQVLATAIDRAAQRRALDALGVAQPRWEVVQEPDEVAAMAAEVGWPVVLKACRGGYDGRGIVVAESIEDARMVVRNGSRWLAEPLLDLDAELAVTVARDEHGRVVEYPAVRTVQRDGICHEVVLPAGDGLPLAEAGTVARAVAEGLGVVGVVTVELFVVGGRVLVNEIAVRPHNSAHLTIEACATSQFENHLRATAGLPLGPTTPRRPAAAMANLLAPGHRIDLHGALRSVLSLPDVHVHLYGKAPRPGRKIGHVTALADDTPTALARVRRALDLLLSPSMGAAA
jgi:5-(carboxyamino)imidazole ribonucleotide synthase